MIKDQQISHDFDEALVAFNHDVEKTIVMNADWAETIRFALKLAKIVTGEPSEGMKNALIEWAVCSGYVEEGIKAMITQAIKEIT